MLLGNNSKILFFCSLSLEHSNKAKGYDDDMRERTFTAIFILIFFYPSLFSFRLLQLLVWFGFVRSKMLCWLVVVKDKVIQNGWIKWRCVVKL